MEPTEKKRPAPMAKHAPEAKMARKAAMPGQIMDKGTMTSIISIEATTLREHVSNLTELLSDISLLERPTGDVTFIALDRSKEALLGMTEVRKSIEKIRSTLKARALARMKEG